MIGLYHEHRVREQLVGNRRVFDEIPVRFGLLAQGLDAFAHHGFAVVEAEGIEQAQVGEEDGRHRVPVQGCEMVGFEEGVDGHLPVGGPFEHPAFEMAVAGEVVGRQILFHATEVRVEYCDIKRSVRVRQHPEHAVTLDKRQRYQAMIGARDAGKRALIGNDDQIALAVVAPGVVRAAETARTTAAP